MYKWIKSNISVKLVLAFLAFGLLPTAIVTLIAFRGLNLLGERANGSIKSAAVTLISRVERNLFERYGDVQAFGLNTAFHDRQRWYDKKVDAPMAELMNRYLTTYATIYYMSAMVDTKGRLIAITTKDDTGKAVDTSRFWSHDFSKDVWFQKVAGNQYLTSKDGLVTGTWVDDAYHDQDIADIFGTDGACVGFSAQVKDSSGKLIGYWHNWAKMELVQNILQEGQQELKASGFNTYIASVINKDGLLLANLDSKDPKGGSAQVLTANLIEDNVAAAKQVASGKTGALEGTDSHGRSDVYGFAHSAGALGYPGLGWSVLVRVPTAEVGAIDDSVKQGTLLTVIIAAVLVAVLAWLYARSMSRPISEMTSTVSRMAQGEVNLDVQHKGQDEIGQLAEATRSLLRKLQNYAATAKQIADGDLRLNENLRNVDESDVLGQAFAQMTSELRQSVTSLHHVSGTIAESAKSFAAASSNIAASSTNVASTADGIQRASDETARASSEVAESSQRQTSAIVSVLEQVAQMASSMEEVSTHAREVGEATNNAVETAVSGGKSAAATIDGMKIVNERTLEASERLTELADKSKQIIEIVQLISDIADQTNLLALNAAIEAARAGDQGRGFAVVADEVRKLAERSSQAADDIRALISEVHTLISRSTQAMQETTDAVNNGAELSESAREALDEIISTVERLRAPVTSVTKEAQHVSEVTVRVQKAMNDAAELAEENAAAAQEMAASTTEVSNSVDEISKASEQQAATTEELTAQAHELANLAEELDALVKSFRLDDEPASLLKAA